MREKNAEAAPAPGDALRAALRRRLPHGGLPPDHVLGPVTALRELEITALSVVHGHGKVNDEDAASLRDDLKQALAQLGPAAVRVLSTDLGELRAGFGSMAAHLSAPGTSRRVAASVQAFLIRLDDPAVVAAAWDDTVAAFRDDPSYAEGEARLQALRELAALRGHDWTWLSRDLVAGLDGTAGHLAAGETGDDADQRLAACRCHVQRPMPAAELVVWVGFSDAELHVPRLELGPVTLYPLREWPQNAYDDAPELRDLDDPDDMPLFAELRSSPLDAGDGKVLARVDLGRTQLAQAPARARELASDAVLIAHRRSTWLALQGAAACVPSRSSDDQWFGVPLREEFRNRALTALHALETAEETSVRLARADLRALSGVRSRDPDALEAIDFLRWAVAVAGVPHDGQRLGLSVRLIERALPTGAREHWSGAIKHYIKDRWVEADLGELLVWTARVAAARLAALGDPGPQEELFPSLTTTTISADVRQAAFALEGLRERLPPDEYARRRLDEVVPVWASATGALAAMKHRDEAFDLLLRRCVRHRNAVLHGADTEAAAVRTARRFLGSLQNILVRERLVSAADDLPLLTRLERGRVRAIERRRRLEAGEPPPDVLFHRMRPMTFSVTVSARSPDDDVALMSATGGDVDLAAWSDVS